MRLPTNDALAALGGTVVMRERLPATLAISTDSRSVRPSETFLALRGERFDGHRFVAGAAQRGASAAIVEDAAALAPGCAGIVVEDTLAAYLRLAALARTRLTGPVVAITGSTGKTTTKTFLRDALIAAGRDVVATPENENNEIGVAKLLLSCDDRDPRVVVVEMGARKAGDIATLVAAARPDVAILTNVGEAHLEIFGSREALAETKWAIFSTGARAVIGLADDVSRARAGTLAAAPAWFGIDGERPPAGGAAVIVGHGTLLVLGGGAARTIPFGVALPGDHNRRNLAAALAAARLAGVEPERVAAAAPAFAPPAGRYERIAVPGGPRIVYDAYNASMSGALATLAAFAGEPAPGRRIAVLGSMAELGNEAPEMHARVGEAAAQAATVLLAGGAFAGDLARGARGAGMASDAIVPYGDNDEAVAWLRSNAGPDDVVLLKGSRMYRMEQIVAGLLR
jgi:UDP-N-acetylmuramoyl-tripeptide--D-alanyl-D-alanine ligase